MIKSIVQIDEAAVKKYNEEQRDWIATCRKCHEVISGSLTEIRGHVCGK